MSECKNESHFKNKKTELAEKTSSIVTARNSSIATEQSKFLVAEGSKFFVAERSNITVAQRSNITVAERSRSLIVISNPIAIKNEASLINNLCDEGLTLFHLRKPDSSEEEIKLLMQHINSKHYSKIVFHQQHQLAKAFGVTRLHFTEMNRKNQSENNLSDLKNNFTHLSTSIHSYKDYKTLSSQFDYTFLGPVFDSISKKNYKALDIKKDLQNNEKQLTKLIALGGITKNNINEPFTWGFDGAAVLGSIWENENPIKEFIQINNACKHCEITP